MRSIADEAEAVPVRRVKVPAMIAAIGALAALYGWALLASTPTHPGAIGVNINALGTDWMVFYGAARRFFDGNLGALYDGGRFTVYLNMAFANWLSAPMPYRPWVYPPSYLLWMLPFSILPFAVSYIAFQAVTAALLTAALYFGADRPNARLLVIGAALLGPAAAINAATGQNAFLTAALLVGGFRVLRTRPALGGIILGLLTYKPQFWFLVPMALIAGRQWKALTWSIAASAGLAFASLAVFGSDCWQHWLDLVLSSSVNPHGKWVEFGRMWGDSVYACVISGGASSALANAAQATALLIGGILTYRTFRLPLPNDRKIAILLACTCTLLAAPHSSLSDMVLLATAAALWISEIHWNTACASAAASWPAMTWGAGRTPTIAVFVTFI